MDTHDTTRGLMRSDYQTLRAVRPGHVEGVERGVLLKVGTEMYLAYGSDEAGWSIGGRELDAFVPPAFRYHTLDELFFALVNFTVADEGAA